MVADLPIDPTMDLPIDPAMDLPIDSTIGSAGD